MIGWLEIGCKIGWLGLSWLDLRQDGSTHLLVRVENIKLDKGWLWGTSFTCTSTRVPAGPYL